MESGNWPLARDGFQQALSLEPGHAYAMLQLSYVESFADRYRAARDWALRAAAVQPAQPEVLHELARRLRTFNEVPALRDIATRLLGGGSATPRLLVECARLLADVNDLGLALRCAEAAVAMAPGDMAARLIRGQLLAHHARVAEAGNDFDWVLSRNPRVGSAWWMLSRQRKQTTGSNHVRQLRTVLATQGLQPPAAAAVARALHKELDDLGDTEDAWRALALMCRIKRSSLKYDVAENRRLFDGLIAMPPAPAASNAAIGPRTPVFIVGMHRSGTTLLEQLFDAHPRVRGIGELYDFASAMRYAADHHCKDAIDHEIVARAPSADFDEAGRRYLHGVEWRLGGESYFTDKLPSNFLNIGFICRALPQAKILHMVRDPVETCFSNLRELFSSTNPYSYDQVELADYYLQYRRLMAHWHAMYPGRILDVDYARLTADPETVMREVAAYCGLDYVDGMRSTASSTRAVATASSVQVRSEVARRDEPKWWPYRQHLQPLIDALRTGGAAVPD